MPRGYLQTKGPVVHSKSLPSSSLLGVDGSKIDPGTVATAALADGSVTQAKFEAFLRTGLKYLVATDQAIAGGVPIPFGTKIYDSQLQASGTGNINFTPAESGVWNFKARIRLQGGSVAMGLVARVYVYDNTAAAIALMGTACPAFTDEQAGGSSPADVIDAVLNEAIPVVAGHSYSVMYLLPTSWHVDISHSGGSYWISGSATVKADAVDTSTMWTIRGSFLQVDPVAQ